MQLPSSVLFETHGPVALITLNRPGRHNALSLEMLAGLDLAMNTFQEDDDLRVAILTGAGSKAFCAGGDLDETIGAIAAHGLRSVIPDDTKRYFSDIYKPIVAAVNGYCIAGGLELLLGTDIRIATPRATFGLGEVRWGLLPANGAHVRLPRQIPWAVAMEMLLMGRSIDAERAREVGLVNRVVEEGELLDAAFEVAEVLCSNGPIAVQTAKEIAVRGMGLESAFQLEAATSRPVMQGLEAREGRLAFLEKRTPTYAEEVR